MIPCSSDDVADVAAPPIDVVHVTLAPAVSVTYAARGAVRCTMRPTTDDERDACLRNAIAFLESNLAVPHA